MSTTILITGATGNISSGVIEYLKDSGHRLLALVRNPDKAKNLERIGVELRPGDLEKPWTLASAFEGVHTAWLLTHPGRERPSNLPMLSGQPGMPV